MFRYGALMLGLLAMCGQAGAQAISGASYIAVQGQAERDVVPDRFPVRIDISETSMDAAATQTRVEALATKVVELVESGDSEARIKVANLSISPMHRYDRETEKQVFIGNTYQRSINVEYKSLQGLRNLIAALPEDKALTIDTGSFSVFRTDEIKRELTREAIANARATAVALADGIGRKLGPVHTISTQGFDRNYSFEGAIRHLAPAPPAPAMMHVGSITLQQDVYIVYELE